MALQQQVCLQLSGTAKRRVHGGKKLKSTGLDASLVGIFPIFPINFITDTLLATGDVNANRL